MDKWDVPRDFADPMANYLIYGYEPGSCFTAILANDFVSAIRSCHPVNTVESLKALAGWIHSDMPREAYGSYERVRAWLALDPVERRAILELNRLIYTAREETWLALKGEEVMA
jgi:hypothetical protein